MFIKKQIYGIMIMCNLEKKKFGIKIKIRGF